MLLTSVQKAFGEEEDNRMCGDYHLFASNTQLIVPLIKLHDANTLLGEKGTCGPKSLFCDPNAPGANHL